ncbi:MAG: hypothetical protein RPS47_04700 [Colwellia sp.]|jgi:hypothetical protein
MNNANEFIKAVEKRETWTVDRHGKALQAKAYQLADNILLDAHSAKDVPTNTWILFITILPFEKSLNALSDLSLILKGVLSTIISIREDDPTDIKMARDIIIGRLNQLMRKDLHETVLTEKRRDTINSILSMMHGNN